MMDFNHLFFGLTGRINRQPFWIGLVTLMATGLILMFALARFYGLTLEDLAQDKPSKDVMKLQFLTSLITLWPSFALNIKRLHDRNRPAIWLVLFYLLNFLVMTMQYLDLMGTPEQPNLAFLAVALVMILLAIWLTIELAFIRGTKGDNEYGPDPLASQMG